MIGIGLKKNKHACASFKGLMMRLGKIFGIQINKNKYMMHKLDSGYWVFHIDFKNIKVDFKPLDISDARKWINTITMNELFEMMYQTHPSKKDLQQAKYLDGARTKLLFHHIMDSTPKYTMHIIKDKDLITFRTISGTKIDVYENNGNYEPTQIDGFQINKGKYFIMTYDGGTGYYDHQVSKDEYYRVKKIYDNQHKRGTK